MPRTPRNNMKASFFHIMVQGLKKEYVFNRSEDIEKYIKLLENKKENVEILAYCIMNNHAHILVKIEDLKSLSKWMHDVNTSFAVYYNKKYERVGYVFRNRFKSQQVIGFKYLCNCVNYIHNNPVKANICKKQDEYKYSSFQSLYNGNIKNVQNMLNESIKSGYVIENHNNNAMFVFIEDEQTKDDICKEILMEFAQNHNACIQDLKDDKTLLIEVVGILKTNFKIPYKIISKQIGISKETLRKILAF